MGPALSHQKLPPPPVMTSHSPSSTTVSSKRSKSSSKEAFMNPSFADLPSSLLEVIMSRLVLKDNIRASAACKSWLDAGVFVRVMEKHPWLFYMSKRGYSLKLVDPHQWKSYTLELPEIAKSTVCYSREGWLLMHGSSAKNVFFFNPFSRELISLPKFALRFNEIAFSYPPTSDHCVVIALNFKAQHHVTISTCHPGATEWITSVFPTHYDQQFYMKTKIAYHNYRFYCFNVGIERLSSFQPSSRSWESYPHANMDSTRTQDWSKEEFFLAETKGELFLMLTSVNEEPMVYKLVSWRWKKMSPSELDGLTLFVSFYNSELTTNCPWIRNSVCFSRFGYNRQHVSYSFDKTRYNPSMEWHNELELCPPQSLCIDPPNNVLEYL